MPWASRWVSWHLGAVAVLVTGLSSCGGAFAASDAVHITSPAPLATVTSPFDASWTTSGGGHYRYAVFVDHVPIAPGHTMRDLALQECKRIPTCFPDSNYLSGLGVYITSQDRMSIQTLPIVVGMEGNEHPPIHTLTIVLFSGRGTATAGHRVGDAAWQVEFRGT